MSRPVFSRVEGGPRGPTIDRSSRYAELGSPRSRAVETSVHPSPRAQQGGALPVMAECSCADPPPQAVEALEGQSWPSGGRHSFRHATLADSWRCLRRPGWGFSMGPALESKGPVDGGGGAQRPPPSRPFVSGVRGAAGSRLGRIGRCCEGSGSWGPQDGDQGCSRAPPAHPAGAGGRGGPEEEAAHPSSPRSLPELGQSVLY